MCHHNHRIFSRALLRFSCLARGPFQIRALLAGVPDDRMIILDLFADVSPSKRPLWGMISLYVHCVSCLCLGVCVRESVCVCGCVHTPAGGLFASMCARVPVYY